jgi:hypothetical protein
VPTLWYASRTTCAPTDFALAQIAFASWIQALWKSTWLIGTSSVVSSIAASIASVGTPMPSGLSTSWMRPPRARASRS